MAAPASPQKFASHFLPFFFLLPPVDCCLEGPAAALAAAAAAAAAACGPDGAPGLRLARPGCRGTSSAILMSRVRPGGRQRGCGRAGGWTKKGHCRCGVHDATGTSVAARSSSLHKGDLEQQPSSPLHSLLGMSGLTGLPSSFRSLTRTRPGTIQSRG